jgi:hypothetical protein
VGNFSGRVLENLRTVRLGDGRKGIARAEERARWIEAGVVREARSPWHKGREDVCCEFRRVLESRPEDWQVVVSAFERIPKVVASLIDHLSISITRPYWFL